MNRTLVLLVLFALAGCGGHGGGPKREGGTDSGSDAGGCGAADAANKSNGAACGCDGECASGFCVDGVCCTTACTDTCKACNVQGAAGTCSFVPSGKAPRAASTCPMAEPSTCGLDGMCDGNGACAKYAAGVTCQPGQCAGASLNDIEVCDGLGRCRPGPATICVPFTCDPAAGACKVSCTSDADCASGIKCVNGSCGPKPPGASCTADSQCASGFCTDGVCCNSACRGACVTCNQIGRRGTCWPVDVGHDDPHNICADQGGSSCGRTGTCDGIGGCALYRAETTCGVATCAGDLLNTARTCDGLGTCRAAGVQPCSPYHCTGSVCISHCTTDADCVAGHACQNGSCGKKAIGQTCANGGECASTFCVDGVCCGDACTAACKSCALSSALGRCSPVAAGADDPHNLCTDQGAASCGTDKKCDGAGACRKYKPGTVCAPEHCDSNVYTPAAICGATGNCVAPDGVACPPFACNGSKCFGACTVDANCSPGNVCTANSCGKKLIGAFCADRLECASGNCAQGVCCVTACGGACQSCALSGTMGQCTDVPKDGLDPSESCVAQASQTCGTTGKCEAGACQKYARGLSCRDASCPATGTTLTPASTCDGAGACVAQAAVSCFPFGCGVAACKSTCTADADCAPPASCNAGSCGLKPPGAVCGTGGECSGGICAQGICCATACTGSCKSCALPGKLGTCSAVPEGGTDPAGVCKAQNPSTCGTTGLCDGAAGCALHAAGVECAGPSCPMGTSTATLARTCDGAGTCRPAATQSCGVYACNGTTCNAACGMDADCAPGNVCNAGGSCGLKRLGQVCGAGAECDSGNCVDGVCCSAASCGNCLACNVAGKAGSCQAVPAGSSEPHDRCVLAPPCGFTGKCDGLGACDNAPLATSCGAASCGGSTFTPVGSCDGAGSCQQTSSTCAPYVCGPGACLTTCSGDGNCATGYTCQSGSCTNLKPNGAACVTGTDCISNHCTEGLCCASPSCGSCNSCAIPGKEGTCAPVPAGPDPAGVCMATPVASCGTTGLCDSAGHCALFAAGTTCAASACVGPSGLTTSACDGAGVCVQTMTDCSPYKCDTTSLACDTACVNPGTCAPSLKCTGSAGSPGVCQPK